MRYYIYKTTNSTNGHFYIGRRQFDGDILSDPYIGSGKRLKLAIKKYGIQNFVKEILEECDDYDSLVSAEIRVITNELIKLPSCYNMAKGGHGGYTFYEERQLKHTQEAKDKISRANAGRRRSDVSDRLSANTEFQLYWVGRSRSLEDKKKKSEAALRRLSNGDSEFNRSVQCPHCDKIGQQANMIRWHFDNCKKISR